MANALYIHIPFCRSICTYCDFPKLAGADSRIMEYMQALTKEIDHYQKTELADVKTIYIGGGTPSSIGSDALLVLFCKLEATVDFANIAEFTIEANPSDVTEELAALFWNHHVTRVSLGVETSHPALLKTLGRKDCPDVVHQAVATLKRLGILDINLDFIYAIPGETMDDLRKDLDFAVSLSPTHLSFYSLILEEKTKMMHDLRKGLLKPADEDLEADMFEAVMDYLPSRGFRQYEISNFALPGKASLHNLAYWNVQTYLGLGMGAHSQIGTTRFHNPATLSRYLDNVRAKGCGVESMDPCDLSEEFGLMGLRKMEGISLSAFRDRFGAELLERYPGLSKNIAQGLLEAAGDSLRLTRRGIMVLNYVERSFLETGVE